MTLQLLGRAFHPFRGVKKLLPHGIPKVQQGIEAFAAQSIAGRGLKPSLLIAYLVVFNETIGAVMLTLGLLTRVIAASVAIEMAVITYVYWPKFGWTGAGSSLKPVSAIVPPSGCPGSVVA